MTPFSWKMWKPEVIGGLTTFFTVAYIVVVNPAILSAEGTGIPLSGALAATVLLCFSMTLLMGLYAKLPFAVAPGMGINAFFTYQVILAKQVPWQTALGMVFWSGVLFLLISLTPLRTKIALAIPAHIRSAAAAGIGLFLSFIGLKNLGLVVADPVTLVRIGPLTSGVGIGLFGLLVAVVLALRKSPFAYLACIGVASLLGFFVGQVQVPATWWSIPDFHSVLFQLDLWGALKWAWLPVILSIVFTDLFDSISTFVGVAHSSGMLDEKGQPKRLREGLIVDAWATLTAGLFGTSSGTAFIESAAGIQAGGRTGRAAVVTAICFLPCFFLAPVVGMIPAYATAPVLMLVGMLMTKSLAKIVSDRLEERVPAFLTFALIPLTFSITQGLLWGMLLHPLLFLCAGRRREVTGMGWVLAGMAVVLFYIENT